MISASSIAIMAAWLIAAVASSWLLPMRWRVIGIALCGMGLLASLSPVSFAFLASATIASFYSAGKKRAQSLVLVSIVIAYVILLSFVPIGTTRGESSFLLPLGMAYYVLRLVHYIVESMRGTFRQHSLKEYGCYQFFPSTLPVGPIHRFDAFLLQLRRRRWDGGLVSAGTSRVLSGACKIVIVGNVILTVVWTAATRRLPTEYHLLRLYLDTVLYWLNIYVQFSGYSDLAIGSGAMMGFKLPENFDFPFVAQNIGEFWRRWHITLASWCREYIYMPVLAQWRRPPVAAAASMVVLGLWHEISLHYLFWGLYHATGLVVWRRFDARPAPQDTGRPTTGVTRGLNRALTLHFVIFSYPVANAITRLLAVP